MPAPTPKSIDIALQGGGAHGAFAWGVLDRLLDEERLRIDGISGTSAGAMNAVVLADGYSRGGGQEGAKRALRAFWKAVSTASKFSPLQRSLLDRLIGSWSLDNSPGYLAMQLAGSLISPYDVNPLNINPLRDLLRHLVDFDRVRTCSALNVFISATNVRTGKARIFRRHELDADTVMASACLPQLFQAVEIDGEAYWDGGYMGNPALFPLIDETDAHDLIIIQINPIVRNELPRSAPAAYSDHRTGAVTCLPPLARFAPRTSDTRPSGSRCSSSRAVADKNGANKAAIDVPCSTLAADTHKIFCAGT